MLTDDHVDTLPTGFHPMARAASVDQTRDNYMQRCVDAQLRLFPVFASLLAQQDGITSATLVPSPLWTQLSALCLSNGA